MKKNTIVEIVSALLLVFYIHCLISNCVQLQSLKNMLTFYTVHTSLVAWMIISLEFIIALLLFIPRSRRAGLLLSSLFVIILMIVSFRWPHNPHDFGGIVNELGNKRKLILGIVVLLLSFSAFMIKYRRLSVSLQNG
ncbi:MAG: hypothetical protein J7621_15390 [Niastella sp.]|nr:hypothetical protein [Niastella sp.]PZR07777.1 MAG: hypothetical protein DI539_23300 [Flavobacterium psychrophilum]